MSFCGWAELFLRFGAKTADRHNISTMSEAAAAASEVAAPAHRGIPKALFVDNVEQYVAQKEVCWRIEQSQINQSRKKKSDFVF